jgi:hypothetical protein
MVQPVALRTAASQLNLQDEAKVVAGNELSVPRPQKIRQKRDVGENKTHTHKSRAKTSESGPRLSPLRCPNLGTKFIPADSDASQAADGAAPSADDISGLFLKRRILSNITPLKLI